MGTNPLLPRESKDVLRLISTGLLSKWGFGDGDMPESVYDYCEAHGIDYTHLDWHATLIKLVRTYLLPALKQDVEVYEIETIHNPIRAKTVNGERVNPYAESFIALTPAWVDVPMAEVVRLAQFGQEDRS